MRAALLGGVLVFASLLAAVVVAQQPPTFRSGVRTVAVYATVRDTAGRLVPDLTKDAFQIFEDGRPTDVAIFSTDPQPLSVAIMLDTSFSQIGTSPPRLSADLRTAVLSFIDALAPVDRASIGTFGMEITVGANLTRNRVELARVLDEEVWGGGGTPLWQAINVAASSVAREPGRRVVLVLTDGVDSGWWPGFPRGRAAAEAQALKVECMVYVVRLGDSRALPADIVRLSETTGGGHVVVSRANGDLTAALRRVVEELRHQYVLGFLPAATDGRVHQVEVRATRPGLRVNARRSYVAEAEQ